MDLVLAGTFIQADANRLVARDTVKTQIDRSVRCALRYLHGLIFADLKCQRVEIGLIRQRDSLAFQPRRQNRS